MKEKKISQDRLYKIIGDIVYWASECSDTILHDMLYAADLTPEEIKELDLEDCVYEDEDEDDEDD